MGKNRKMDFSIRTKSTLIKYNDPEIVPPPPPPPPEPYNKVQTIKQKPDVKDEVIVQGFLVNRLQCKDRGKSGLELQQVLNSMLPPRIWVDGNGVEMRQTVSTKPSTRLDVINLKEQFNMRLKTRQARPTGICPIRDELYKQCFDELIRQVSVNCLERGLLLIRIRDEVRMTQGAYRALYESAAPQRLKKESYIEEGIQELEEKYEQAVKERKEMLDTIQARKIQIERVERRHLELIQVEEDKFKKESEFLKRAYVQIQEQYERIINYNLKTK